MIDASRERVELTVGGLALEVVGLVGEEALSTLFRIAITCASKAAEVDPSALVGATATVKLRAFEHTRTITALIAEAESLAYEDGNATLKLVLRPLVYQLTLGSDCRVFQHQSVVQITTDVLARGGVDHRWDTTSGYPEHIYIVQYRQSDHGFFANRITAEGIYYWFDHRSTSQLVLADNSTTAPDLEGGPTLVFTDASDLHTPEEVIYELGACAKMTPNKFSVTSFDSAKPDDAVGGSTGDGGYEIYDAPGAGPSGPGACAGQANIGAQHAAAAAAGVAGRSSSVRLVPGMVFTVTGHPAGLDGSYCVTRSRYTVTQRRRGRVTPDDSTIPYECEFEAIRKSVPYRPAAATTHPQQMGLQSGVVVGPAGAEVYPNASGDVRLQMHWDRIGARDENAGRWTRVAQRGTVDSMLLPRMGWNVLTFNAEGSVDEPKILSRVHDAEHPPAYALPANKTRVVFKTATTPGGGSFNEIYFEDRKGEEEIFMNASRDMEIFANRVKNESIERDHTREVVVDENTTINEHFEESVRRHQFIDVGNNEEYDVSGKRTKRVAKNESVSVGSNRNASASTSHETTVKFTRSLTVGAALIDTTMGVISSQSAQFSSRLVGGVSLKLTPSSIKEDVGGISVQTVGGARIEIAKEERTIDAKDTYTETIGVSLMMETEACYIDTAEKALWKFGNHLGTETPELYIEAQKKIQLVCGASSITILPEGVEFVTPELKLKNAASVESLTGKINHN